MEFRVGKILATRQNGQRSAAKKKRNVKRRMKKRRIIQPILWTERPTGAVMGVGSLWPWAGTQFGPE
jgi:hypothetical protein